MSKKNYTFTSEYDHEAHTLTQKFEGTLKLVTDFKNKSIFVANDKAVIIKTEYEKECFTLSEYEILLMQAISSSEMLKEYNNINNPLKETAK